LQSFAADDILRSRMATESTHHLVREELARVLSSSAFARNERLSRFLRYLVERHLEGKDQEIKESLIALEVFERRADYDPKLDSIVRTEAMRLRARLATYYASEGSQNPLIIELPKGAYRPVCRARAMRPANQSSRARSGLMRWIMGVLAALAVATVGLAWWWTRPSGGLRRQTVEHRYETNSEAYDLYLRGRHEMESFPTPGRSVAVTAVRYFEQAIARDPNYAIAYAGMADALRSIDENVVNPEAYARAKVAAAKAIALDPRLSEAHSAMASIRAREYAWVDAERQFRHAIDLKPENALAHLGLGFSVLLARRDADEGLAEVHRAVALDPFSPSMYTELGRALLLAGHIREATDQLRKAIALDPSRNSPYNLMGRALSLQGKINDALTLFDETMKRGASTGGPPWLACVEMRAGRRQEALALLQEQMNEISATRQLAETYACLGDEERAVELLDKAIASQQPGIAEILQAPELTSMRASPRFALLRKKVNLAP
jgi:Tfp pilus assembly protein PilF